MNVYETIPKEVYCAVSLQLNMLALIYTWLLNIVKYSYGYVKVPK